MDELEGMSIEELVEISLDKLAESTENWIGDTATDEIARAVIGNLRPLIEAMQAALKDEEGLNRLVFGILVRQFMTTVKNIQMLDTLAGIRKENEE